MTQNVVQTVDVKTVKDWLDENEIVLVDVRETTEYEQEHIAGALLLPLSSFEADLFPILKDKKVVIHCAVGKRSEAVGKMLIKEGRTGIIHMAGGLDAWKAAGYPTEIQIEPPENKTPEQIFLCPPPGDILRNEYLKPLGITPHELARRINVLEGRIADVLAGESPIGVELSMRLARYFSTAADFWIHLQIEHDMERARHKLGEQIRRDITPRTATV